MNLLSQARQSRATFGLLVALAVAPPVRGGASQPFLLTFTGSTATQIAFSYPVPAANSPCTINASVSYTAATQTWGQMATDVDATIFANANVDLERPSTLVGSNPPPTRTVVLGQRTAELNSALNAYTRHYSRALQAATTYSIQVTCPAAASAVLTAATTNIPLGNTYGDPWLSDPLHPGDQPFPETTGGLPVESTTDPYTGSFSQLVTLRSNNYGIWRDGTIPFGSAYNQGQTTPCDTAGPWISPCGVVNGSAGTTVGASTAPLVLRPPLVGNNAWNAGYGSSSYNNLYSLDQFSVTLAGSVDSTAFDAVDMCLSMNDGGTCTSAAQQITLTGSNAPQTINPLNTSQFGVQPWLLDPPAGALATKSSLPWPRFNLQEASPHSGTATVLGDTVTWVSGDLFSLYWITGGSGHIRLSAINDACITPPSNTTSTEYAITGFVNGNQLTVSGTPPAGNAYWCANNFAVMVWRDKMPTDGSTVTLTSASMGALEGYGPTYPQNGAGTACFTTPVAGGFACLYGGLYLINPRTGASAYYGYMLSSGQDGSGNYIANPWKMIGTIPSGDSADIDQTQTNLTFYSIGLDPSGGGPLVIQGVFNPPSFSQPATPYGNGSQIQNASVTSTTAYSVSYSNGLTFTNLTPQVTASESIVEQMAAFDPTFNPSYFNQSPATGGGWNCSPGGMSAGVFYSFCFSIGGDSPAWIFAFSPGDGNPAHAGQSGGPRIVGAISTFNTPQGPVIPAQTSLTGRSLHGVAETGETGWIALTANPDSPINTVNASVPAVGPLPCEAYGLTRNLNDCILFNINSYTAGGVTGYEPYFPEPLPPFVGSPGELRTTQLGDSVCVATSTPCSWSNQQNELMTLVIKNYEGVDGASVCERDSYGAEVAIAEGPLTLTWISNQWVIPPGGTTASAGMTSYWSPLMGCGGSPDPHGDCLLQDWNNTGSHGEWRDGGEAVATNVPEWEQPIYGWPTDYQTGVGSVPGILGPPAANVTPNLDNGVNYTSANPGFACYATQGSPPFECTFGTPWGFDAGTHPNPAGAIDPNNGVYAFDNVPVQGGENDPPFALVTGQLYVATPPVAVPDADNIPGYGSVASINRKTVATAASCGSHPLIDVSGPASVIGSDVTQSYTYCATRVNGECQPGSTAGEIFVNCPGVVWSSCSGSSIHGGTPLGVGNDICVSNMGVSANAIRQFALSPVNGADPYGAETRNLVSATGRLRMASGFENNAPLPDTSWLLYRAEFLNYQRCDMWMAKIPCYPGTPDCPADGLNRGQFIPLTVNIPGYSSADGAVVEFGYQENGLTPGYSESAFTYCTTRQDSCWANTAAVLNPPYSEGQPPFYFKSENPPAMRCPSATGCMIAIPAISQRMVFYHVLYFNGTNLVATTTMGVASVP